MRKSFVTLFVAGMLAVSSVNGPVLADDSRFNISDYIPERFEDFQWRLNGNLDLRGDSQENESKQDIIDNAYDFFSRQEHSSLGSDLATYVNYDYTTVQRFLETFGELRTDFTRSTSDRSDSLYRTTIVGLDSMLEHSDETSINYIVSSVLGAQAGQYLRGDFFMSAELSGGWSYGRTPKYEVDYDRSESNVVGGLVQIGRWTEQLDIGSEDKNSSFVIKLMPGWGRVYDGVFASTAIYMIDELRSHDALLREPTRDEMLQLTEIIYQDRQRHVIDERLRRIETLDTILNYLVQAGITDASGRYGQLLVQDVWDYFPRNSRQFGLKTTAGIGTRYSYNKTHTTTDVDGTNLQIEYPMFGPVVPDTVLNESYTSYRYYYHRTRTNYVFLTGQVSYFKPLTRKWQLDIYANIDYTLDDYHKSETTNAFASDETAIVPYVRSILVDREFDTDWELRARTRADYIYDSRTSLYFNASYAYSKSDFVDVTTEVYDNTGTVVNTESATEKRWVIGLRTGLSYRIAIPTTLTVAAGYSRSSRDYCQELSDNSSVIGRYSLSVSLEHYLY